MNKKLETDFYYKIKDLSTDELLELFEEKLKMLKYAFSLNTEVVEEIKAIQRVIQEKKSL